MVLPRIDTGGAFKTVADARVHKWRSPVDSSTDSPVTTMSQPASETLTTTTTPAPPMSMSRRVPRSLNEMPTSRYFDPAPSYGLDSFDVVDILGTGTFGKVLLVKLKKADPALPRSYFAVKVLHKGDVIRLRQVEHTLSEKQVLSHVSHPFLINLFSAFQDKRNCYMVMDYVPGGEIFSHLRKAGRFTADVARFYIANVILAIEYLHERDIVYRDLKPENILLGANGYVKLADFGFAKQVPDRTWTLCGTPEYLAPEIIQSQGHGKAVDYWSLGILLFEMLAGYPPFYSSSPIGVYERILQGIDSVVFPPCIDRRAQHLIRNLLQPDLSQRLGNLSRGMTDLKQHPWFTGVAWPAVARCAVPPPFVPQTVDLVKLWGTSRRRDRSILEREMPAFFTPYAGPGSEAAKVEAVSREPDPYHDLFEGFDSSCRLE